MTEWDKLRNDMASLIKQAYDKDKTLLDVINAWYRVRVVGDKLHQVNKELKKELESCAEKSWIKREKLEAIHKICPCLDDCTSFVKGEGCVDWKCALTEKQVPLAVNFALEVLGE